MLKSHRAQTSSIASSCGHDVSLWAELRFHTDVVARYWSKDWADCYRKLLRTTPVTVNGTAYVNVSFEAQTHNDDNADTHARL